MLQLGNNVADGKVTESFVLRFEDMEKINAFRGDRVKAPCNIYWLTSRKIVLELFTCGE